MVTLSCGLWSIYLGEGREGVARETLKVARFLPSDPWIDSIRWRGTHVTSIDWQEFSSHAAYQRATKRRTFLWSCWAASSWWTYWIQFPLNLAMALESFSVKALRANRTDNEHGSPHPKHKLNKSAVLSCNEWVGRHLTPAPWKRSLYLNEGRSMTAVVTDSALLLRVRENMPSCSCRL